MLGTGPPLTGLGDPCSAGAGDVGAQPPGDAGLEGPVGSELDWQCLLRGRGLEWADEASRSSDWA